MDEWMDGIDLSSVDVQQAVAAPAAAPLLQHLTLLPPSLSTQTPGMAITRCDSTRASFEPIPDDDDKEYSFDGFIAEFGCAQSKAGGYCARVVVSNWRQAEAVSIRVCFGRRLI